MHDKQEAFAGSLSNIVENANMIAKQAVSLNSLFLFLF
jgi:hypothetical protein